VSISMLPYCRVQLPCFHRLSSCFYLKHRPIYISKHNVSKTILSPSSSKTYSVLPNLKTETESSLWNVVFWNINRTVFETKTGRWLMPRSIIFVLNESLL
jgi:hypothetical protein